jgi:hypothetical protein
MNTKLGIETLGFIPCTLETEAQLVDTGGSSGETLF